MDWFPKPDRPSSHGSATPVESADRISRNSERMSRRRATSALRALDRRVGKSEYLTSFDTWGPLACGIFSISVGMFNVGRGEGFGWLVAAFGAAFIGLFIFGVAWRWKSDQRRAYFAGQDWYVTETAMQILAEEEDQ